MKLRKLVLTALLAASLTAGKTALAFLPNIEIVTLLCGLYGYSFGMVGVAAVFVFVGVEVLIWGFGTWIISYLIYWPMLTILFMLLNKKGVKNRFLLAAAAVLSTVFFGVLTSLIDVGLFSGYFENFGERFVIYYLRGIPFYVTQIICNAVLYPLLFPLLSEFLRKQKKKLFSKA